jgi:acyl-homoserine-lactone acylase
MLDPAAYPGNDTIINNLRQWDRRGDADSKGAAVFSMVYDQVTKQMRNRSISILTRSDCEALISSIGKEMREQFGKTDLRLGDIQKLVRGEMTFPASGLPDLLAPEYGTPIKNGIRKITGGDAYVALVRFRKDGLPIIETSNTYGASSKKESPHFADQVPLFLEQKTKRMTLDKAEVLRTAVRTYHPGE